jgi:hypothetical protein
MGQVKKQYQEWVEQHIPQEVGNDFNDTWTEQFEQFITKLMQKQFKEESKDE